MGTSKYKSKKCLTGLYMEPKRCLASINVSCFSMYHIFYDVMLKGTLCCQGLTGTSSSCQLYSLDPSLGQMEDRFQHKHPLEFPVVVISVLLTVLFTVL